MNGVDRRLAHQLDADSGGEVEHDIDLLDQRVDDARVRHRADDQRKAGELATGARRFPAVRSKGHREPPLHDPEGQGLSQMGADEACPASNQRAHELVPCPIY